MERMAFPDRAQLSAVALAAALTLGHPGLAQAAQPTAVADIAQHHEISVEPGQTLTLEPDEGQDISYAVDAQEESALPAGWSVLTSGDGLRITASATAADGEYAAVKVSDSADHVRELRIVVDRHDADADAPGGKSQPSSSWIDSVLGKIAAFLAS